MIIKLGNKQVQLNVLKSVIYIFSILVLTSCEEVIEIDLNSSNPVLVAEGQMVKDSTVWIKLSYTRDYFTNEETVFEETATVVITNSNNTSEILSHTGNGMYKGTSMIGEVGEKYNVDITTDKGMSSAVSNLFEPSEIYDVKIIESNFQKPGGSETSYSLEVKFKDISIDENFYLMKVYVDEKLESYVLADDKIFIANDTITFPLIQLSFYLNDEVIIKLHTVDEDTYRYYSQLADLTSDGKGPGGSSTPFNPGSNFGKDVMGYFAAWSFVSDTIVIQ